MSQQSNIPTGIKLENTSFGQSSKMNTYAKPQFINPTNPVNGQKGKPRGGWEDDDEPTLVGSNKQSTPTTFTSNNPMTKLPLNVQNNNNNVPKQVEKLEPNKKFEIKICDDEFFNIYEYENRIIQEAVQPSGARLKQSDAILNEFCRACESLPAEIVSSVLFHNLSAPVVWTSKAKTIFAIEVLVKKMNKYFEFFKYNIIVLKSKKFTEEGPNAPQLKKILDDVIDFLEGKQPTPVIKTSQQISNVHPIQQNKQPIENASINTKQEPQRAQPQKLNPFNIPSSNPPSNSTVNSKPSGLPGAFKNSNNVNKSMPKSTSSVSSQDETPKHFSNVSANQPTSNTSVNNKQINTNNNNNMNTILESLAGLDFSDNNSNVSPQSQNNNASPNNLYNLYAQQPSYGMSNGPMSYPGQDPNMGGFPMQQQQQPYYPYQQYNSQMYPPQFQGQYPNQQYNNYQSNYPMQGFQGQMSYGAPQGYPYYPDNQYNDGQNSQQVDQADEFGGSNEQSIAEMVQNQEQERLKQEELIKKQKQKEIESKFDSLKYLI